MLGEWSDEIKAFWLGANGNEYISWKGSRQIFVYPTDKRLPSEIWEYHERIETLEQFNDALITSKKYVVEYKEKVSPNEGGCWFCHTKSNDMLFDTEFDTYLHKECLENALKEYPDHPEATVMSYLLSDYENLPHNT